MSSPLHRLEPETKLVAALLLILVITLTPLRAVIWLNVAAAIVILSIFISRVPFSHHFKRLLTLLPFILLVALSVVLAKNGWQKFELIIFKSSLSILTLSALFSTTTFPDLLKGLEKLKSPKILTLLFAFLYRYVFIFEDRLMRMVRAAQARNFSARNWRQGKILSNMVGTMLIGAYERGERVYQAMAARGYEGL